MALQSILLTTFGSLGDLHPYLAIGQELRRRGYGVRLATQQLFRERVEEAGLEFRPLRAATTEEPSPALIRRVFAGQRGVRFLLRDLLAPMIRTAYEDTLAAADGVSFLISHPITLATPLVADRLHLPWLGTQLAPSGILSAYDPPVLPGLHLLSRLHAPPAVYRGLFRLADWQVRRWLQPVDALRKHLGLPDRGNPFFEASKSPFGILGLFSPLLATPQLDWPAQLTLTGFPIYDQETVVSPGLEEWLAAGPAPVVFTLGSSAVLAPGRFFRTSLEAARHVGRRALLVGYVPEGIDPRRRGGERSSGGLLDGDPQTFVAPYAAYSQVFRRAAVIVHQGGIGTTAEALRAGRPMLVVPFGVDQPDNGARIQRIGAGRTLPRRQYQARRVARELQSLLGGGYAQQSAEIGVAIEAERGAARAADAVERVLRGVSGD